MQGVPVPAPAAVRRYRASCDSCPTVARLAFYRQPERDSFARRHVLANAGHRVELTEETISA
jgi:hypothetical protein